MEIKRWGEEGRQLKEHTNEKNRNTSCMVVIQPSQ
jgi:hypothetical protein